MNVILLFCGSVFFLLLAHIVRAIRWRVLLTRAEIHVSSLKPLTALSIGYFFNMLLPLRLGELLRTSLLSYTTRARFSSVLATVAVERLSDLLVVTTIIQILLIYELVSAYVALFSLVVFSTVVLVIISLNYSVRARRYIWFIATLFNNEIKSGILNFFYFLLDIFAKRSIFFDWSYWRLTCIMWSLYLISLLIFSEFVGSRLILVASAIYIESFDFSNIFTYLNKNLLVFLYLTIPIPFILVYAYLSGFNALAGFKGALREAAKIENFIGNTTLRRLHGFRSIDQYHSFLDRFFNGNGGLLSDFEQRAIQDVRVHRIFHGGSGAVTALIEVADQLRVRKYANGALAKKLKLQYDWLQNNCTNLKLVRLISGESNMEDYYYDMHYAGGSIGFYEGIHTESVERSILIIDEVIDVISKFHDSTIIEDASEEVVRLYVDEKIIKNFEIIKSEFFDILDLKGTVLNGLPFDFKMLDLFGNKEWFISQFKDRRQSVIHGDLTIENIMLNNLSLNKCDWFLIDPNPDNVFQSPLIDFSKLMQSLHLGYESLHRMPKVSLTGNRLNVDIHRSSQYANIYSHVLKIFDNRFGKSIVKQIFVHELVNFLRLIPYQLKQSRESGLVFFSCLCLLLRDFDRMFPGEMPK